MTDLTEQEAVRIVATFRGWKNIRRHAVRNDMLMGEHVDSPCECALPNYAHDRDALILVAKKLLPEQQWVFLNNLLSHLNIIGFEKLGPEELFAFFTCPAATLLQALAQTIKEGKL